MDVQRLKDMLDERAELEAARARAALRIREIDEAFAVAFPAANRKTIHRGGVLHTDSVRAQLLATMQPGENYRCRDIGRSLGLDGERVRVELSRLRLAGKVVRIAHGVYRLALEERQ